MMKGKKSEKVNSPSIFIQQGMLKNLLLPLTLFISASLPAQKLVEENLSAPVTEATVQIQEIFIDGNREKLLGNWEKAATKFQEVLQKDSKNDAAAYELARVYEAMKDLDKATANAKNAVEWDPSNSWYKKYLAELYQKTSKDLDAASLYEQLVKAEPYNEEYYFKWAYYLVRAGKPDNAVKVYDQLEKLIGTNEEVTRHKHTLYLGMGNYKKAAKELETLISKFPDNPGYRHLLATFYEQTGEKEKAAQVYKEILAIDPNDARAKIALAEEAKGNDDIRFLNSLKPVFENPSTNLDTKIKEIMPYIERLADTGDKNLGTTLLALTSLLETVHPNSAKVYSALGDVLYHSGQKDKALEKYKKCLELDDNVWSVWEQVLYIYAEKNDYDNLIKSSESALDLFPNQAVAHYLNGFAYNGKGRYEEALDALQQALIMSSKNPRLRYDVLNETGIAYFHQKKYAQSDNAFEEALKINSDETAALKNYAFCLASRGEQLDKAKQMAARLLEKNPDVAAHENVMAFVLYKMKDFKNAKDLLDRAMQNGGDNDPSVLEHLGDVQFQLGNVADAVRHWQKAVELGGNSALLKKKAAEGKLYE